MSAPRFQVDGLTFRWVRAEDDRGPVISISHVLDSGRLTFRWTDDAPPDDADLARAVRVARAAGWHTSNHLHVRLDDPGEPLELPDAEHLVDQAAHALGAVAIAPRASQDAALQVVLAPTRRTPAVLTFRARGGTARVELYGMLDGVAGAWRASTDADWLRDTLVLVRSTPATPPAPGLRIDGLSMKVTLRAPDGFWSASNDTRGAEQAVRVAATAAWRMGMDAFLGDPWRVLARLHVDLRPPDPPMRVQGRTLTLFGAWGWPDGARVIDALTDGPWTIDARDVSEWSESFENALRTCVARRSDPVRFIGRAPRGLDASIVDPGDPTD